MSGLSQKMIFGVTLFRWAILGAFGTLFLVLSIIIRGQLDIDWTIDSLRSFVHSLGVWGALAYIGILTFRFIFLIPTGLLLLASGILFGPLYGTLYAGLGMFGSGVLKYVGVQIVGRDLMLDKLPMRLQVWVRAMAQRKMSALALAGVCAYPFFPKHIFQFAAIISGMGVLVYIPSVLGGSFARAAIFANLGQSIYTGTGLVASTTFLIAGLILPMCVPSWRHWMLGPLRPSQSLP